MGRIAPTAIEVVGLTKRFGPTIAVQDLSFSVAYGRIAGFLGPNGAGKTTALRALLGLLRPTAGVARLAGQRYRDLADPAGTVGAALDGGACHPGRSARQHLRALARAAGVAEGRVEDLLGLVGLEGAADRRAGGYSLGMRQRLGLAVALLGDPGILVLDEPANGLDPEGTRWLRGLMRSFAAEGRAVLVSSHVLGEVAQSVDEVVIISSGRSVLQASLDRLLAEHTSGARVAGPGAALLGERLRAEGAHVVVEGPQALSVRDRSVTEVGRAVADGQLVITELSPLSSSLEDIYLELTTKPNGGPQ